MLYSSCKILAKFDLMGPEIEILNCSSGAREFKDVNMVRYVQNLNKAYFKNLPYLRTFHRMVRSKRAVLETHST